MKHQAKPKATLKRNFFEEVKEAPKPQKKNFFDTADPFEEDDDLPLNNAKWKAAKAQLADAMLRLENAKFEVERAKTWLDFCLEDLKRTEVLQ